MEVFGKMQGDSIHEPKAVCFFSKILCPVSQYMSWGNSIVFFSSNKLTEIREKFVCVHVSKFAPLPHSFLAFTSKPLYEADGKLVLKEFM